MRAVGLELVLDHVAEHLAVDREHSSPTITPARAAGDPGATASTRAAGMRPGYGVGRQYPRPVPVEKVLLAEPRGFCAGVEMAIKALAWMVRVFEPPVYCYHEIVHNRLVVDRFREQGVIFVDDVDAVPAGAPLMLSAHGPRPRSSRPPARTIATS